MLPCEYDDSDADPDYCLPKKSKDQGSDSDRIEFQQLDHYSSINAALGEPSTTPGPGQSTISAALGEPSTTTAPGPGQSSTISAALGEPSSTPGPGQSSTISAALCEPSTTCAANGEPSIPKAILRPSTSGTPCTPLIPESTGLPSTAAARETAVLITSTQTLGEKRQYSDTRKR
ncbi:hypothetical protein ElyMa_003230100 [Elysia marginata]|uniref:Uncharacterized protein n=1 Tax=Elysia marginata TaxID=1093978 RepID=A0AAV4J6F5_9GAST|nr:hypothetical protein ElyMa_003230100 [Elysia marginata]